MPKFKKEYTRVSISSTFLARARCKHCKGLPQYYFFSKNKNNFISTDKPRKFFENIVKMYKAPCDDYYLSVSPSNFKKISDFTFVLPFMNYTAKLHKNKGVHATRDYSEYISCSCGRSIWAFYEKYAKQRLEIIHHKSVYKCPQKFEY